MRKMEFDGLTLIAVNVRLIQCIVSRRIEFLIDISVQDSLRCWGKITLASGSDRVIKCQSKCHRILIHVIASIVKLGRISELVSW